MALPVLGQEKGCEGGRPLVSSPLNFTGSPLLTHTEGVPATGGPYFPPLTTAAFPLGCFRSKAQQEKWGKVLHGRGRHLPDFALCSHWAAGDER